MKMNIMNNTKNYYQRKVFQQLDGNAILVHSGLKKLLGGINEAIWFSQMLYWYDKPDTPGIVLKSRRELEKETGLTRDQQIRIENRLKKLGVIKIEVRPGKPSLINHISINFDKLSQLIPNLPETLILEPNKSSRLTYLNSVHQQAENTENISENTHNITHNKEPPNVDGKGYKLFQAARDNLAQKITVK